MEEKSAKLFHNPTSGTPTKNKKAGHAGFLLF
jgi:hypothetical protein